MTDQQQGLLAIDVGTSRVKFGWFPDGVACAMPDESAQLPLVALSLPSPAETFTCRHRDVPEAEHRDAIRTWLQTLSAGPVESMLAAVHEPASQAVASAVEASGFPRPHCISKSELPLNLAVREPERVGIDRLLNAVAVNQLRDSSHAAVVIDSGTACTVDLISAEGVFLGGAILPGITMAGWVLHTGTDSLPLITSQKLRLPEDGIGQCTEEAISTGIYWGLVGAIERLVAQYRRQTDPDLQLFLTGGDAGILREVLHRECGELWHLPHLVLSGIAVAKTQG